MVFNETLDQLACSFIEKLFFGFSLEFQTNFKIEISGARWMSLAH